MSESGREEFRKALAVDGAALAVLLAFGLWGCWNRGSAGWLRLIPFGMLAAINAIELYFMRRRIERNDTGRRDGGRSN